MRNCKCKYMEELFSDNDIATEILSRLPIKSLMAFKCTAKRWYSFLSDPLFVRIHYQRSNDDTLLSIQKMIKPFASIDLLYDSLDLLTPTKTGYALNYKFLDFLPEKVSVLSSSHGILCCRSWVDQVIHRGAKQKKTVTYICNPITRQWVQLKPNNDDYINLKFNTFVPGFVFYPFCSSSSSGATCMFKLVRMFRDKGSKGLTYGFDIYSSDTNKWKRSEALCKTQSILCPNRVNNPTSVIFANGWLHWWTRKPSFIVFHVEKELCKEIQVPCDPDDSFVLYDCGYICWGESDGYFHYVYAAGLQLQVWVLKNYDEPAWELKYCLDMVRFSNQHSGLRLEGNRGLQVLTFHEDVVYIDSWLQPCESVSTLLSYDFKTKTLIDHGIVVKESEKDPDSRVVFPFHQQGGLTCPMLVPFGPSLLPLDGVHRSKRNRKRKLLDIM